MLFASAQAQANELTLYGSLGASRITYEDNTGEEVDNAAAMELGLTYGFGCFWQLRLHANVLEGERVDRSVPADEPDTALREATVALHVGGRVAESRLHLGAIVEFGPERAGWRALGYARIAGEAAFEAGHGFVPFVAGHRIGIFYIEDLNGVERESTNNVGRWMQEGGVRMTRQRVLARASIRHQTDVMAGRSHELYGTQLAVAVKQSGSWSVYARAAYARAEVDHSPASQVDVAFGVMWGPAIDTALEQMTPTSPLLDLTQNL